jgi:hypothetical protein
LLICIRADIEQSNVTLEPMWVGPDENPEQLRVSVPQLRLQIADQPLDVWSLKMVFKLQADIRDHLIRRELAGQDSFHSNDAGLALGGIADRAGNLGRSALANQQVLALSRQQNSDAGQQ